MSDYISESKTSLTIIFVLIGKTDETSKVLNIYNLDTQSHLLVE